MALPIDLVLVRHGQSEGNLAKRRSENGDHSAFTEMFKGRHTSSLRLTELGRKQAALAGEWIRQEFFKNSSGFDRHIVSEYLRAMETAGLLGLPDARWYCDFYLCERDWGDMDLLSEQERNAKFGEALRLRDVEPFFWRPSNGNRFAELCLFVDRVLHTLHRECSDKRVILVCHGEVMWAIRVRLERMSQRRFKELHLSKDPAHRIHNCQIIHYSRRAQGTGELSKYANWMRMIRPTDNPVWTTGWTQIERPNYSNEDLLNTVSLTEPVVTQ